MKRKIKEFKKKNVKNVSAFTCLKLVGVFVNWVRLDWNILYIQPNYSRKFFFDINKYLLNNELDSTIFN